jgi:valyl-tRNA synthetase
MQKDDFSKKYNHDFEEDIYKYWLDKGYFTPEKLEETK